MKMARLEIVITAMKMGTVFSQVRGLSTLGSSRSDLRLRRGPFRASGGGTRGRIICDADEGDVVVVLCLHCWSRCVWVVRRRIFEASSIWLGCDRHIDGGNVDRMIRDGRLELIQRDRNFARAN